MVVQSYSTTNTTYLCNKQTWSLTHFYRARSSELLEDDLTHPRITNNGSTMFASLSYAIGTSEQQQMDEGGGVEPTASAVIANYFLKSHGGVHGVQSLTSLCAVLFGMGTYFTPSSNLGLKARLMQRTLICALAKHLSGFLGAATMSAVSIPDIGWRQTRMRIEGLALDPVAQYLFYCALLIVWTNGAVAASVVAVPAGVTKNTAKAAATAVAANFPWWLKDDKWRPLCLMCILSPILVREVVSTIWVLADVLVLYHFAKSPDASPAILTAGKSLLDAIMSLLFTPKTWRPANAQERQSLLAKLVGKTSLGFEVGTCLILVYDAMRAFIDFSVAPVTSRPSFFAVAKRLVCARLMVNFMLVRRKKVTKLVTDIRGGATHVPGRVLDCLLEPSKAMGLDGDSGDSNIKNKPKTLAEWASLILGF